MNPERLPPTCPKCGCMLYNQRVTVVAFATKRYSMVNNVTALRDLVEIEEIDDDSEDLFADILCNKCGLIIHRAGTDIEE